MRKERRWMGNGSRRLKRKRTRRAHGEGESARAAALAGEERPICPSPPLPRLRSPSRVSPLAADEYSPALSVDSTVPPNRAMADSNDSRVRVDGS